MTTFEMNFEDLQSKYEGILREYHSAKNETSEL
jgi:DNA repair exonuclease SbcCD ATPase subunit